MQSASAQVNALHAEYCSRTGFEIALNFQRERQWGEWLAWRREKPFTVDDLRRVIGHIRQGIHKGDRNDGALKFSNLIGQPDRFEEDLGLAIKSLRPPSQAGPPRNYRPIEPPAPGEAMTPEEFASLRAELGVTTRKVKPPISPTEG